MNQDKRRFLIVDDHEILAQCLAEILTKEYGPCETRVEVDSARVREVCREYKPHLVLMDINLPGLSGLDVTRLLLEDEPALKVIALSGTHDSATVRDMMAAGAFGYVIKSDRLDRLEEAIDTVLDGNVYLAPELLRVVVGNRKQDKAADRPRLESLLTPRELEIFKLIGDGMTSKAVGSQLGISVKTVDTHRKNIMDKAGFESLADWIRTGLREGLIQG